METNNNDIFGYITDNLLTKQTPQFTPNDYLSTNNELNNPFDDINDDEEEVVYNHITDKNIVKPQTPQFTPNDYLTNNELNNPVDNINKEVVYNHITDDGVNNSIGVHNPVDIVDESNKLSYRNDKTTRENKVIL